MDRETRSPITAELQRNRAQSAPAYGQASPGQDACPTPARHGAVAAGADACSLLQSEDRAIQCLFKDFSALAGSRTRPAVRLRHEFAMQVCNAMTMYALLKEQVFYPALRSVIGAHERLAEGDVEIGVLKALVAAIQHHGAVDVAFDAKVKVLQHCAMRHFEEDERVLLPLARASLRLDLAHLGARLVAYQQTLTAQARASAEQLAALRREEADVIRRALNAKKRLKYQAKVLRSR